jgi:hypothetical protein
MTFRKPPAFAMRLIRFDEALAGDLVEEFQRGRSTAWFWRQCLWGLLTLYVRRARAFPPELQALLIGHGAQVATLAFVFVFRPPLWTIAAAFVGVAALVLIHGHLRLDHEPEERVRPLTVMYLMPFVWFLSFCLCDGYVVLVERPFDGDTIATFLFLQPIWLIQGAIAVLTPPASAAKPPA